MPTRKLALAPGQNKDLILKWGMNWKNIEVSWKDRPVMTIPGKNELLQGREVLLDDGSSLAVKMEKYAGIFPALMVSRNGVALQGSDGDMASVCRNASYLVGFLAVLNLVIAAIVAAAGKPVLGLPTGIFGIILAALSVRINKGSAGALLAVIILYSLDTLGTIFLTVALTALPLRIFLILALVAIYARLKDILARQAGQSN